MGARDVSLIKKMACRGLGLALLLALVPVSLQAASGPNDAIPANKTLHHIGLRSFILPNDSPALGRVVATYGKAMVQIAGDRVRLHFADGARPKVGERIVTFDLGRALHHPHSGHNLGRLAQISGSVIIESVDGDEVLGRVEKTVLELMKGQSALPASLVLADAVDKKDDAQNEDDVRSLELFRDVTLQAPSAKLSGAVVSVEFGALVAGNERLAFIDRGSADGLRIGDVISILPRKTEQKSWTEQIGKAVVVATQKQTATCQILSSISEVEMGDGFTTAPKLVAPTP